MDSLDCSVVRQGSLVMEARRCLWSVLLMCLYQQTGAVDKIYTSCSDLAGQGTIEVNILEADTQDLIDANPSQYRDRIGLAVTEGVTITFSSDASNKLYPAAEYFQLVEGERTDTKGTQWLLQLNQPIDRESGVSVLEYGLHCGQAGAPASFYTLLKVWITDRNDNSPVFAKRKYEFSIGEDPMMESIVAYLSATDSDAGENKEITYRLEFANSEALNEPCKFNITNPSSGGIYTSGLMKVNGDVTCNYNGVATDGGSPPRSGTAQVAITILERDPLVPNQGPTFVYPECVQDESGYCLYPAYTASIPPSWTGAPTMYTVPAGSSEGLIQARDKDQSSPLRFYIADTDAYKDYFTVSTMETSDGLYEGEITLNTPLADGTYNFILDLRVEETSRTPMSAAAMIYVRVLTADEMTTPAVSISTTTTSTSIGIPAPTTDSVNVAAIVLGVVVALLLLIILLLVIYIVRRRSSKEEDHYAHLSATRAPSRTYNVIDKPDNSRASNGRTNDAATYELETKPESSPDVAPRPPEPDDGAYVDIIG